MRTGEKADLIVKPKYGYGDEGLKPAIPPKATLTYTIQVIEITERNLTEEAIRASEAIAPTKTEGENPQTDIFKNNR